MVLRQKLHHVIILFLPVFILCHKPLFSISPPPYLHLIYTFRQTYIYRKRNTAMIIKYLNKSGKSGVKAYEILPSAIRVQFIKSGKWYSYSYTSAGMAHVEQMKKLALSGFGLNSYIQRWVRPMYDKQLIIYPRSGHNWALPNRAFRSPRREAGRRGVRPLCITSPPIISPANPPSPPDHTAYP